MRYRLLDTLRGFSLVSMFLYHICWDLVHMYGFDWPWWIWCTCTGSTGPGS